MRRKISVIGLPLLLAAALLVILWLFAPGLLERYGLRFGRSAYNTQTEERQARLALRYADAQTCRQCHAAQQDEWQESQHRGVTCETCHGPGLAHIETRAALALPKSREDCGVCHDARAARPASFPQVSLTQHYPQSACTTCHNPMGPARRIRHPVAKDTNCVTCHQPQGLARLPASHASYTSAGCQSCHWR